MRDTRMRCTRCHSPMIVTEQVSRPRSTQTWYECTNCSGQRLLSIDTAHSLLRYSLPLAATPFFLSKQKAVGSWQRLAQPL